MSMVFVDDAANDNAKQSMSIIRTMTILAIGLKANGNPENNYADRQCR